MFLFGCIIERLHICKVLVKIVGCALKCSSLTSLTVVSHAPWTHAVLLRVFALHVLVMFALHLFGAHEERFADDFVLDADCVS